MHCDDKLDGRLNDESVINEKTPQPSPDNALSVRVFKRFFRPKYIVPIVACFVLFWLFIVCLYFSFVPYRINSSSMKNTLKLGDRIVVNRAHYFFNDIKVGDIVVFKTEGINGLDSEDRPYYIQRVVGLPGDDLEIRDGKIYRNGEDLNQPPIFQSNEYVALRGGRGSKFKVPKNEIFVFGDNSKNSWDSRVWGGVPVQNVVGKAFYRYWPSGRIGAIVGVPLNAKQIKPSE